MPKKSLRGRLFYVTPGAALFVICSLAIAAQSGRRVRKPELAPVPAPEETPSPKPAERPKPVYTFIVGLDRDGSFSRLSLNIYDGVVRSCAGRLDDSGAVKAEISTHDMTRGDAVKQAKAEKEAYIVLLHLRSNSITGDRGIYDNANNVYIEYAVFAPTTAKQVTSGNTYPQAYGNRRIRVPTLPTEGDYYLNQAARGAAERILDHFHLHPSNTRP